MDPLDEVFAAMRVEQALHARLEATAPWGLHTRRIDGTTRFGLMLRGRAWLSMGDAALVQPVRLEQGDCFFIPRGAAYTLQDDIGSPTINCVDAVRNSVDGVVVIGGKDEGEQATVLSGWFHVDPHGAGALSELPPLLHVRMDDARTRMLQSSLQLLALETTRPGLGSGLIVSRLADILFVQAVRAHVQSLAADGATGWLAALADHKIGATLRLMHRELAAGWTVESLAVAAGMSRSAFAQRFRDKVGRPPLDYLAHWRMFRAQGMLRHSEQALAAIAAVVGYDSEAAFNKAFKRRTGVSPGLYRRQAKQTAAEAS
ncbi:AraC family transcriptional regulator [Herbaspirillum hiltneri N3]|uniref:AraC family transcriptional regulator n=1 Tax=Herbaspirillum hiltneri N3 TaxID=1262470 RepID=A0ABM5V1Q7_9BURK|nr:AraC family transcriptional regulator [Herbaspirillum hiltneri]AKZ63433.1 AraC family transcriptional regulator [Herbaspirillum hiltneri N3]